MSSELDVKKEQILKDIASDAPKALRSAFGWAALGLALLIAALTFIPWMQGLIRPDLNQTIKDAVDARLMERSAPLPAQSQIQIDKLTISEREILKRLDGLSQKIDRSNGALGKAP